jgi:P-type E1-E2 ATPase
VAVLAALLITLIPTTIAALLSAIGIAGMDRLVRFNVLAKSGRAVEAAGDIDVLLLDKTGTITVGDRAGLCIPSAGGRPAGPLVEAALLAAWPTRPRGPLDRALRAEAIRPAPACPRARKSFPSPPRPAFGH